jgi:hypothetical protein
LKRLDCCQGRKLAIDPLLRKKPQSSRSLDYYLRQPVQVARAHPNIMTPPSAKYSAIVGKTAPLY